MTVESPAETPLRFCQVLQEEYVGILSRSCSLVGGQVDPADEFQKFDHRHHENCLPGLYRLIDKIDATNKPFALCLSGGGIRSATVGLGVLQGLAKHHLLDKLDYLSTVSGGGYVGSWLMAWIHRHENGAPGVFRALRRELPRTQDLVAEVGGEEPEPKEISHLRRYSNYLTPKPGLLSADVWTMAAMYLRNLFVNWLMLGPLLASVLLIPRLCLLAVRETAAASPLEVWLTLGAFGFGSIAIAHTALYGPRSDIAARSHPALKGFASQKFFLIFCLFPLILGVTSLVLFWAPVRLDPPGQSRLLPSTATAFIVFGAGFHLLGWGGAVVGILLSRAGRFTRGWLGNRVKQLLLLLVVGILVGSLTWLAATMVYPGIVGALGVSNVLEEKVFVVLAAPLLLSAAMLAYTFVAGLTSRWLVDEDQEWLARLGGWLLIYMVFWSLLSALTLIVGPAILRAIADREVWRGILILLGGVSGLVTLWTAVSSKTPAAREINLDAGGVNKLRSVALTLAAPIFAAFLVVVVSAGATWLQSRSWSGSEDRLDESIVSAIVLLGIGVVVSFLININQFSLHGLYRNRLVRAYLGASNPQRSSHPFTGFDPNDNIEMYRLQRLRLQAEDLCPEGTEPGDVGFMKKLRAGFTPLAEYMRSQFTPANNELMDSYLDRRPQAEPSGADRARARNVLLDELNLILVDPDLLREARKGAVPKVLSMLNPLSNVRADDEMELVLRNRQILATCYPEEIKIKEPCKPLHVINTTLNLVGGDELAWLERKAALFTVTPYHAGCHLEDVGYRRSRKYGRRKRAITLGTAATISGAAASPNMGYYSSPAVGFLMTLFNARLGWWLGNPGKTASSKSSPRWAVVPLIQELFGATDLKKAWFYLSDGGHFDNLGLYSMILRRCHTIIVVDASADPEHGFDNLGNAIRKTRIDLGVEVTVDEIKILPRPEKQGTYFAFGEIDYYPQDASAEKTKGHLIYIKPALYLGKEPIDVRAYASRNPQFPHETTTDQWFGESQFESYRALGKYIVDTLWQDGPQCNPHFKALKSLLDDSP